MRLFLFLIIILIPKQFFSQLDNIHYLQPIIFTNYSNVTVNEEYIYLSTNSQTDITVKVTYSDGVTIPVFRELDLRLTETPPINETGLFTFKNSTPLRLRLATKTSVINPGTDRNPITRPTIFAGQIINAYEGGLIFTSVLPSNKFYVNYRANSPVQAGSVLTKGQHALGTDFIWGGTPTEFAITSNTVLSNAIGNMASMTATEDDTTLTISNINPKTEFLNGTDTTTIKGPVITRTLDKGESFILYAKSKRGSITAQDAGWLGSKITANKKIVVTVGGLMQQGADGSDNQDFAVDQLVPIEQLGTEHIIMQGNGGTFEKVVLIATKDNTEVKLNGSNAVYSTLANIGDYIIIPANQFVNKNMYVNTDKSVYVFHKIYGSSKANTNSFMFIPPLSCFGQNEVDMIPDASRIGDQVYSNTELAVLTLSGPGYIPKVTINNAPVIASSTTAVQGNSNRTTYRYKIGNNANTVKNLKITSAGVIQAELMGSDDNAGFGGYSSGFGLQPVLKITVGLPVDININGIPQPCAGQSTLTVDAGLASYQWQKNGINIPLATTNTYQIPASDNISAEYNVVATVIGGCLVYSEYVTSVVCTCDRPGATGTALQTTTIGISTRDNRSSINWPTDVNNSFIALESNDKGFVVTRVSNPESKITNPINGMLIFDKDSNCLKIYDGTKWSCIEQTCN